MKHVVALILLIVATLTVPSGHAQSPDEVVARVNGLSNSVVARSVAIPFCTELLARWPQATYQQDIQRLGQLWHQAPDAAYLILSTCQAEWSQRYFNPIRYDQSGSGEQHKKNSLLAPLVSLFRSAALLKQEIRAYRGLPRPAFANIPPAPYELLSGMAASEKSLDEAVSRQMRDAVSVITTSGGLLASSLMKTQSVAVLMQNTGAAVGQVYKYALIGAIVAGVSAKALDYGIWEMRYSDLLSQVTGLQDRMIKGGTTLPVLLDEYFTATERLGYFLSYDVYLRESRQGASDTVVPQACTKALDAYYAAKELDPSSQVETFTNSRRCKDASVLWLEAADFLTAHFPGSADARWVANELYDHAAATYLSYKATWAYLETLPVCRPSTDRSVMLFWINKIEYDCFDRKTGGQIL